MRAWRDGQVVGLTTTETYWRSERDVGVARRRAKLVVQGDQFAVEPAVVTVEVMADPLPAGAVEIGRAEFDREVRARTLAHQRTIDTL